MQAFGLIGFFFGVDIITVLYGHLTLKTIDLLNFLIHFRRKGIFHSKIFLTGGLPDLNFKPRLESRG
ncbi:MAG: hypothetical protein A2W91_14245 [Bacteroidetes bacterium GWF2_38_335]|nr:MAG: hypothetical protein A2W91_14245 [Bacteroidetes bacterium GWF2_38_335]OFY79377.1 MAG: hypothetical protein A2281_16910 [Bacteroidetes bacterium RIFOXYA12_FULL_38_20]HBS85640.1 hypothetical protein [Bacteroidales bacterium]